MIYEEGLLLWALKKMLEAEWRKANRNIFLRKNVHPVSLEESGPSFSFEKLSMRSYR